MSTGCYWHLRRFWMACPRIHNGGWRQGTLLSRVCACISWCIWQLWDFGWRMSKREIIIMTVRDNRVWVSATLGLAASLVLTLCGRNRKRSINKGPCELTTSKQHSFRAYMVKCHGPQREKHSPTHSTLSRHRALSSAPWGSQQQRWCAQRTQEWSVWGRGLHLIFCCIPRSVGHSASTPTGTQCIFLKE